MLMKNEVLIIHPTITKKKSCILLSICMQSLFLMIKKLYNIIEMRNRETLYIVCSHI